MFFDFHDPIWGHEIFIRADNQAFTPWPKNDQLLPELNGHDFAVFRARSLACLTRRARFCGFSFPFTRVLDSPGTFSGVFVPDEFTDLPSKGNGQPFSGPFHGARKMVVP